MGRNPSLLMALLMESECFLGMQASWPSNCFFYYPHRRNYSFFFLFFLLPNSSWPHFLGTKNRIVIGCWWSFWIIFSDATYIQTYHNMYAKHGRNWGQQLRKELTSISGIYMYQKYNKQYIQQLFYCGVE